MIHVDQVTLRRRGTGLIAVDLTQSAGGYTLFAPQTDAGNVYLIDIEGGTVVHSWKLPYRPGRDAVILPNGNLGYNGNHPDSPNIYPAWSLWHGGAFFEVTPDGKVVWQYSDYFHHHDAQWLPNGNTHITEAATGRLFEVTPDGRIVWEYVIPYLGEYPEEAARKYVPGHHNSVFRSYRYSKSQISWIQFSNRHGSN